MRDQELVVEGGAIDLVYPFKDAGLEVAGGQDP